MLGASAVLQIIAQVSGLGALTSLGSQFGVVNQAGGALMGTLRLLGPLLAMGTAVQGFRTLEDFAAQVSTTDAQLRVYEMTLKRLNIDQGDMEAAVQRVSKTFKVMPDDIRGAVTMLARTGASIEDVERALVTAAASTKNNNRDVTKGINNFAEAVATGRSELTEYAGIVVNSSEAYDKYAAAVGKSTKQLTEAEKAHAFINAALKENQYEVEAALAMQSEYTNNSADMNLAIRDLEKTLGRIALPTVSAWHKLLGNGIGWLAATVKATAALDDGTKESSTILKDYAARFPQSANAMRQVIPVFSQLKGAVKEYADWTQRFMLRIIVPIFESLAPTVEMMWNRMKPIFPAMWDLIKTLGEVTEHIVHKIVIPTWNFLQPALKLTWDNIVRLVEVALAVLKDVFKAFDAAFRGDWESVLQYLGAAGLRLVKYMNDLFVQTIKLLADLLIRSQKAIAKWAEEIGPAVGAAVESGKTKFSLGVQNLVAAGLQYLKDLTPDWFVVGENWVDALIAGVDSKRDELKEKLEDMKPDLVLQKLPNGASGEPGGLDAKALDSLKGDTKLVYQLLLKSLITQESNNNTSVVNSRTGALGRYQVMPQNILGYGWDNQNLAFAKAHMDKLGPKGKGWDAEFLGRDITPREYLSNPKIQDEISQRRLAALLQKFVEQTGSMEQAVKMVANTWYTGDPTKYVPARTYTDKKGKVVTEPSSTEYSASVWKRVEDALNRNDVKDGALGKLLNELLGGGVQQKPTDTSNPYAGSNIVNPDLPANYGGAGVRKPEEIAKAAASAAEALAKNRTKLARDTANNVIEEYQRELQAAGDNEQKKAAVYDRWQKAVISARKTIREADSQDVIRGYQNERNKLLADNPGAEGLKKRKEIWASFQKLIDAEAADTKKDVARLADDWKQETKTSGEDLSKIVQGINSNLVGLRLVAARQQAEAVLAGYEREMVATEGNGEKQLAVAKKYAQAVRTARMAIITVQGQDEVRALTQQRDAELKTIPGDAMKAKRAEIWGAYATLIQQAQARTKAATADIGASWTREMKVFEQGAADHRRELKELADDYQALSDSVQQAVQDGTFDPAAMQDALATFNGLSQAAKDLGVFGVQSFKDIRSAAYDLIQDSAVQTALTLVTSDPQAFADGRDRGRLQPEQFGFSDFIDAGILPDFTNSVEVEKFSDTLEALADEGKVLVDTLGLLRMMIANAGPATTPVRVAKEGHEDFRGGTAFRGGDRPVELPGYEEFYAPILNEQDLLQEYLDNGLDWLDAQVSRAIDLDMDAGPRALLMQKARETLIQKALDADLAAWSSADPLAVVEDAPVVSGVKDGVVQFADPNRDVQGEINDLFAGGEEAVAAAVRSGFYEALDPEMRAFFEQRLDELLSSVSLSAGTLNDLRDKLLGTSTDDVLVARVEFQADTRALEDLSGQVLPTLEPIEALTDEFLSGGLSAEDFAAKLEALIEQLDALALLTEDTDLAGRVSAARARLDQGAQLADGILNDQFSERSYNIQRSESNGPTFNSLEERRKLARDMAEHTFREETRGVDKTSAAYKAKWRKLQLDLTKIEDDARKDKLSKFNTEVSKYIDLGRAIGGIVSTVNEDLGANIQGLMNVGSAVLDIGTKIAAGDWVGAATALLTFLGDAITGYQRVQAEAAAAQKEIRDGFSIINVDKYAVVKTRSRGWLADLFGGGPEIVREVNETALNIARSLEGGVKNGLSGAIRAILTGEGNALESLKDGLYGAVFEGISAAVIDGVLLKGALGAQMTLLTDQLVKQDYAGAAATIQGITASLPALVGTLDTLLAPIKGVMQKGASGASAPGITNGTLPGVQYGVLSINGLDKIESLLTGINRLVSSQEAVAAQIGTMNDRLGRLLDNVSVGSGSSTLAWRG